MKIFATDLEEYDQFGQAITTGIYLAEDITQISQEILDRYFLKTSDTPDHVQVIEEIQPVVEFRKQDLLSPIPIKLGLQLII